MKPYTYSSMFPRSVSCCVAADEHLSSFYSLAFMNNVALKMYERKMLLLITRSFSVPAQKTLTSYSAPLHWLSLVSPRVPCAFSTLLWVTCSRVHCPLGSFRTHKAPVLLACNTYQGPGGWLQCDSSIAQVSKWSAEGMGELPKTTEVTSI